MVSFGGVGTEINTGQWTGLLDAVVSQLVDMALEKIPVTQNKLESMRFTHTIISASHHIYLHPTRYSTFQDIFTTPFNMNLMVAVAVIATILAMCMGVIRVYGNRNNDEKDVEVTGALIWIIGILTMQGSIWSPTSTSGSITMIASLLFAIIIYNSYSAFITSMLSVQYPDIRSLDDLFSQGYSIGYVRDGADEKYIQTMPDSELSRIYVSGYSSRVANTTEGLRLAAKTKYAFFVSGVSGRKVLSTLEPLAYRCQIEEFILQGTNENLAFPMSKQSPYFKIINLSILKLKQAGILSKMRKSIFPSPPPCKFGSDFNSAQIGDVITAFKIILSGVVASIIVIIGEYLWKYRTRIKNILLNIRCNQPEIRNNRKNPKF